MRLYKGLKTVPIILLSIAVMLGGCDVSSRRDMRRAEKMLKKAEKVNAEFWSEREYRRAQKLFEEAMDLARLRKVNQSRDKAAEAFLWAEDAYYLSVQRYEEMEREKKSLQKYE